MSIAIFGINHKTAPVEVREEVAFSPAVIEEALKSLKKALSLAEVAVISTCNRMEVIFRGEDGQSLEELQKALVKWLAHYHQLPNDAIASHSYFHQDENAIKHLMAVASGLDSMVLGEPQILGQVKDAYGYANNAKVLGRVLNRLFQDTFSLAKRVRTETKIGESAVSVAYAAVTLAKRIFSDFDQLTVLFVGAGETIELAARHLKRQGVTKMLVANRTVERAQSLAKAFCAEAYSLNALPDLVEQADIIISSTAAPVPIIGKGLVEKAITARKHRRIFMVDLAVPRDIEPQVAELNDVYLYTVDDMHGVIQENLEQREQAAQEAHAIVARHCEKFISWRQSLASVSILKAYRAQMDELKTEELNRVLGKLNADTSFFESKDIAVIEKLVNELANRLSQKMMHKPSQILAKAHDWENKPAEQLLQALFSEDKK